MQRGSSGEEEAQSPHTCGAACGGRLVGFWYSTVCNTTYYGFLFGFKSAHSGGCDVASTRRPFLWHRENARSERRACGCVPECGHVHRRATCSGRYSPSRRDRGSALGSAERGDEDAFGYWRHDVHGRITRLGNLCSRLAAECGCIRFEASHCRAGQSTRFAGVAVSASETRR